MSDGCCCVVEHGDSVTVVEVAESVTVVEQTLELAIVEHDCDTEIAVVEVVTEIAIVEPLYETAVIEHEMSVVVIDERLPGRPGDDGTSGANGISRRVQVDCGSVAIAELVTTITDVDVDVDSVLIAQVSDRTPTGKDADEVEMDEFHLLLLPGAGEFELRLRGLEGDLHGKFWIDYLIGAA